MTSGCVTMLGRYLFSSLTPRWPTTWAPYRRYAITPTIAEGPDYWSIRVMCMPVITLFHRPFGAATSSNNHFRTCSLRMPSAPSDGPSLKRFPKNAGLARSCSPAKGSAPKTVFYPFPMKNSAKTFFAPDTNGFTNTVRTACSAWPVWFATADRPTRSCKMETTMGRTQLIIGHPRGMPLRALHPPNFNGCV